GSIPVPQDGVGIWCRDPREIADRAARLRPCCIIIDATGRTDVAEIARSARDAAGSRTIIAAFGDPGDPSSVVDCVLRSREELSRVIRFALGENVRVAARVSCSGRAIVSLNGGQSLDLAIVDLCEQGVRVETVPGLPDEEVIRLQLRLADGTEITTRARPVRRAGSTGHTTVAYQFVDHSAGSHGR